MPQVERPIKRPMRTLGDALRGYGGSKVTWALAVWLVSIVMRLLAKKEDGGCQGVQFDGEAPFCAAGGPLFDSKTDSKTGG
jgi:hypothetical protein